MLVKNVLHAYKGNEKELLGLITDCSQKGPAFEKTLQKLGADTFLIEEDYVDKDYLEDYTSFYARCHRRYERFCKRVHFFKHAEDVQFNNDVLNELLSNVTDEDQLKKINDLYLGFIVLKPSKNNTYMIGTTCLAHYPNDAQRNRTYTAVREYPVNLFGIPLSIESMAFQEQDETVAMCASIAVWSAFSITGKKYQHRILSPSAVTNLALSESSYTRDFPNDGLTPEQMAVAMSKVRLKPVIIRTKTVNNRHLKGMIYAYSKAGIPVVCGLSLYNEFKGKRGVDVASKSFHAVTINGFSFEDGKPEVPYRDELKLVSSRMTQFYAHDDQLCPFTKMVFDRDFTSIGKTIFHKIQTSWQSSSKAAGKNSHQDKYEDHKSAKVESLIIPLYHKIRITYTDILLATQTFASDFNYRMKSMSDGKLNMQRFEWDIFLTDVSAFKRDILKNPPFPQKEEILKGSFAKYLWRSQARLDIYNEDGVYLDTEIILELVFDATDSKKKGIECTKILYNEVVRLLITN